MVDIYLQRLVLPFTVKTEVSLFSQSLFRAHRGEQDL